MAGRESVTSRYSTQRTLRTWRPLERPIGDRCAHPFTGKGGLMSKSSWPRRNFFRVRRRLRAHRGVVASSARRGRKVVS